MEPKKMYTLSSISSPVGMLTVASDGLNVTGLWIEGQKYHADTTQWQQENRDLPVFTTVKKWLDSYFSGKEPSFTLPLAVEGSPFRQAIWRILSEIPYGQIITYGQIANRMERKTGKRMSAQAVGGAVGRNPISIIIPCHRVVGTNGSLTGYAGGIDVKVQLLELENTSMSGLFIPSKGTAL